MAKQKGSISRRRTFPAESLRPVLKRMHRRLNDNGLPKHLRPSNGWLIFFLQKHLEDWLNWNKVEKWLRMLIRVQREKYPVAFERLSRVGAKQSRG